MFIAQERVRRPRDVSLIFSKLTMGSIVGAVALRARRRMAQRLIPCPHIQSQARPLIRLFGAPSPYTGEEEDAPMAEGMFMAIVAAYLAM
ncbi:hypothetical protein WMO32_03675 [Xanthomonas oryzae pv. oryzicola]|uniref:hypothetical protein n=2 Tax=Xanthomonas oryzae TaxID=347 RepID=UPI000643CAF4|nr:hypothetical protein [Xanthomonas oryzae]AKK65348.1 hypothetical protein FE36_16790 [Xanthomonas oryzae pv. oryzicola]AKN99667.1 hypothetical protein ACU15_03165 [Xanthomonas oryzae pv. oryzicola]KOR51888.1 hypothetical protein ADT27_01915 [Xanthomonas oryzae]OLK91665.1 hypothetical protein BXOR1_00910 [Xanthomonas oryzae pv. oryzicola]